MLVHSMLPRSVVNGPGERAVIWFQGCDLRCRGCFNPASHPFNRDRDDWLEPQGTHAGAAEGQKDFNFKFAEEGNGQSPMTWKKTYCF